MFEDEVVSFFETDFEGEAFCFFEAKFEDEAFCFFETECKDEALSYFETESEVEAFRQEKFQTVLEDETVFEAEAFCQEKEFEAFGDAEAVASSAQSVADFARQPSIPAFADC